MYIPPQKKVEQSIKSADLMESKFTQSPFGARFIDLFSNNQFALYLITFVFSALLIGIIYIFFSLGNFIKVYFDSANTAYFLMMLFLFPLASLVGACVSVISGLYKNHDDIVISNGVYIFVITFFCGGGFLYWYVNT